MYQGNTFYGKSKVMIKGYVAVYVYRGPFSRTREV